MISEKVSNYGELSEKEKLCLKEAVLSCREENHERVRKALSWKNFLYLNAVEESERGDRYVLPLLGGAAGHLSILDTNKITQQLIQL